MKIYLIASAIFRCSLLFLILSCQDNLLIKLYCAPSLAAGTFAIATAAMFLLIDYGYYLSVYVGCFLVFFDLYLVHALSCGSLKWTAPMKFGLSATASLFDAEICEIWRCMKIMFEKKIRYRYAHAYILMKIGQYSTVRSTTGQLKELKLTPQDAYKLALEKFRRKDSLDDLQEHSDDDIPHGDALPSLKDTPRKRNKQNSIV